MGPGTLGLKKRRRGKKEEKKKRKEGKRNRWPWCPDRYLHFAAVLSKKKRERGEGGPSGAI